MLFRPIELAHEHGSTVLGYLDARFAEAVQARHRLGQRGVLPLSGV
jgi:hypothetical protein